MSNCLPEWFFKSRIIQGTLAISCSIAKTKAAIFLWWGRCSGLGEQSFGGRSICSTKRERVYRFIHTKRATAKYAQRLKKGRATRKGMDGGKGGQTLSLQEREGENRKQSANLGRNEKVLILML